MGNGHRSYDLELLFTVDDTFLLWNLGWTAIYMLGYHHVRLIHVALQQESKKMESCDFP